MTVSLCFQVNGQNTSTNQTKEILIPTFTGLLQRPVKLKPGLKNVHPRLFFTANDLPKMRERAKGADRELWLETLKDIKSLNRNPPATNDERSSRTPIANGER